MTKAQLIAALRAEIAAAGSLRRWARDHRISAPFVSRVLSGEKAPGDAIPAALGLIEVVMWRRKDK